MDEKEIAGLVSVVVLLVLVVIIIILFSVFVRRKNKLLQEQTKAKEAYERELAETQIEIREETLRNISWELHDNIGQLMTLAKIQVQLAKDKPENLEEASQTIGLGIQELRTLSKLINPEALKSLSLNEAIQLELERFNLLQFIDASFIVKGDLLRLDSKVEVFIFRILQEFFSNTIKHSKASHLDVVLTFYPERLLIEARDNGIGFKEAHSFSGIGLKNMKNRAELINAKLNITSHVGEGTSLNLEYIIS